MIGVLIVHPHPSERAVIGAALSNHSQIEVVGLAGDARQALALTRRLSPTVTLLDNRATRDLHQVNELADRSSLIMMTRRTEHRALVALLLRTPVRGLLVHGHFEPSDLASAVTAVASGLGWLSPVAAAVAASALRDAKDDRASCGPADDATAPDSGDGHASGDSPSRMPRAARNP
ncbi:response regulator transcription factor [Micromonospora sp. HNM0581]|uniref:response regulator transcription factor n=1 Tax=Micromonospora sp. HNM0581 TaxID=2716341 RepID=UPI00146BF2DE|nr:response regulator transcription factor [Micromonospora sp. HNM0581]NLU79481.1 response regulator transcription factor [Micromonospora sp. HNM0581]